MGVTVSAAPPPCAVFWCFTLCRYAPGRFWAQSRSILIYMTPHTLLFPMQEFTEDDLSTLSPECFITLLFVYAVLYKIVIFLMKGTLVTN